MRGIALALLVVCLLPAVTRAQELAGEVELSEADLQGMADRNAGDASGEPLSEADLKTLGLGRTRSVDRSLKFSGFADFTLAASLIAKKNVWRTTNYSPGHPSFYVGNFNVYLSKYVTEKVMMLGEVRFSYLPNGSTTYGVEKRTSTSAADYADFGRTMRWGGIEIERLVIDWVAHPNLTIRLGQFLTPYGIWNVDHGSPTYIPPRRPWLIGSGWFPERQTGIELLGSVDTSLRSTFGYHLTLSNGTGPVSEYADLDDNKAIGGRLYWEYRPLGRLRLGISGYYGRDTTAVNGFKASSDGKYSATERVVSQYDALALAADALWTYRGIHVQTEWIFHQRAYTKAGRTRDALYLASEGVPADLVSWGGYLLAGYRFEWFGIMPYVLLEREKTDLLGIPIGVYLVQGGLNVRPVDALVFKLSYEHIFLSDSPTIRNQPLRSLQVQLAWAF